MRRTVKWLRMMGVILIATLSLSPATAQEKGYPSKPVSIIVSWPAGGLVDTATRALAKEMQGYLGQPVIVENRSGASGLIGGEYVKNAKPDGYTIGVFSAANFAPEVYTLMIKAPYTSQDVEPVIRWMIYPYGLVSRTDMPWKKMDEFIKYVQGNPNKVKLGHTGFGHVYHILFYSVAKANKLEVIEVPFKGAGDLNMALLGGHVDVGMTSVGSIKQFIQTGKLRMLAIHYPKRMSGFPEIPTFEEMGYLPGFPYYVCGLFVPKGTPGEAIKKIHDSVKRAMETPSLKTFAKENLFDLYYGSPSDLRDDLMKESEIIGPLVEDIAKKYK